MLEGDGWLKQEYHSLIPYSQSVTQNFRPTGPLGFLSKCSVGQKLGLDDIIKVVESSAVVNHAQLVGTQDGQVIVPTYDWAQYLTTPSSKQHFKVLRECTTLHSLTSS